MRRCLRRLVIPLELVEKLAESHVERQVTGEGQNDTEQERTPEHIEGHVDTPVSLRNAFAIGAYDSSARRSAPRGGPRFHNLDKRSRHNRQKRIL